MDLHMKIKIAIVVFCEYKSSYMVRNLCTYEITLFLCCYGLKMLHVFCVDKMEVDRVGSKSFVQKTLIL